MKKLFYVFAMLAVLGLQVQSNSAKADSSSDMLDKAGFHVTLFESCHSLSKVYDEGTFEIYIEDADFLSEKYKKDVSFGEGFDKAMDQYLDAAHIPLKINFLCLYSLSYFEGFRAGRELNSN